MTKTPVRFRARALAILMPFLCVLGVGSACTQELRTNGQACLKGGDCLSGVCANSVCVAAPPLLDAEVNGDGSLEASTEGGDAAGDAGGDVTMPPKDSGKDVTPPMEAASETGTDGSGMGGDGGADGGTD